jgi:hypothetical protein
MRERKELPPVQFVKCERCGHDRTEHHAANLSDGPFVGLFLLICPTSVFKAKGYDVFGKPFEKGSR